MNSINSKAKEHKTLEQVSAKQITDATAERNEMLAKDFGMLLKRRAFKIFIWLISKLPIQVRAKIGRMIGTLFALAPTKDREIALLQMKRFLGPQYATNQMYRQIIANFGESVFETLDLFPYINNFDKMFSMQDVEGFKEITCSGSPCLVLTAHTGNWDLMAAYTCYLGMPLLTAAKKANKPILQEHLAELRERYGIKTIWRTSAFSSRGLIHGIREGRALAALIDQDTKVDGIPVPFFGELAATPSSVISIAQRNNLPIVAIVNFRTAPGRFQGYWRKFDASQTPLEILTQYNQFLEALIRQYPDQWVWFHKRWRTIPGGERLSSDEYLKKLRRESQN